MMTPQPLDTLRNGAVVVTARPAASIFGERNVVLALMPWNDHTPYVTWLHNPADGETYWGRYFTGLPEASADFACRGGDR